MVNEKEIVEFYENNSNTITCEKFGISYKQLSEILSKNNVELHNTKKNRELTNLFRYGVSNTGSSKELREKAKQTTKERYGNENYRNVAKALETREKNFGSVAESYKQGKLKQEQTNFEKYGVKSYFQSEDFLSKAVDTNTKKYGVSNFRQSKDYEIKYKETCSDRYGIEHYSKTEEYKDKVSKTCNERYNSDTWFGSEKGKQTVKDSSLARFGVSNPMMSEEVKEKQKQSMISKYGVDNIMKCPEVYSTIATNRQKVASDGTTLDSNSELLVYEFCMRNDIPVERNIPLKYKFNGSEHVTYIDFRIAGLLFEVKGGHLLNGCYDYQGVPISRKLELYKKNHVIVITEENYNNMFGKPNSTVSNGLKYLHKCAEPLIGIDISLFDNPKFPYKDDRPPCFYDVKVDGHKSSFEAFNDEKIRWDMILNRIQYSGGFIDARQILTALNVTRTCKQPSWFSKTLAKNIIKEYCTSPTIVDPFAGWGARYDAALELGRNYVGSDFNSELVEWHNNVKHRNIKLCDANNFYYDKDCSVFICPPYSDPKTGRCFEDYNFEGFDNAAKNMSQCDWLKLVMKNVPNAREYVMVCKVVDKGWEKYIVNTKTNKSHFGINNEYILVVKK